MSTQVSASHLRVVLNIPELWMTQYILKLFLSFFNIYYNRLYELNRQNCILLKKSDTNTYLNIGGNYFSFLGERASGTNLQYTLHKDLQDEGDSFIDFWEKGKRDAKTLQMWLPKAYSPTWQSKGDLTHVPPSFVKSILDIQTEYEYIVPEGKEKEWEMATNLIDYYLSLAVLV